MIQQLSIIGAPTDVGAGSRGEAAAIARDRDLLE